MLSAAMNGFYGLKQLTGNPPAEAATPGENPNGFLPNTNFRDGIIESFTASQTYPGHIYLTYEDWDAASGQFDVKFTQTVDVGNTWLSVGVTLTCGGS